MPRGVPEGDVRAHEAVLDVRVSTLHAPVYAKALRHMGRPWREAAPLPFHEPGLCSLLTEEL